MKFYVYEHWRPDTGTCFYVGKGRGQRAYNFNRQRERSFRHVSVVHELRKLFLVPDVRFVATDLSEADAFDLERQRIKFWRDQGIALANLTDGGDGASGRKWSAAAIEKMRERLFTEDHRKRISEAKKGIPKSSEHKAKIASTLRGRARSPDAKINHAIAAKARIGIPRTPEVRAKISAAHKGKPKLWLRGAIPWCKGKHLSETTRQKMSDARRGKRRGPMPLVQRRKIRQSLLGRPNLALKGKPLSEDHKRKLVEAWVRRKARTSVDEQQVTRGAATKVSHSTRGASHARA